MTVKMMNPKCNIFEAKIEHCDISDLCLGKMFS